MNRIIYLILLTILILTSSCLHREFEDGRYEIKSVSDTALHDSSLVFGHVHDVGWPEKERYFKDEFEIWTDNSSLKTTTDTSGYFSLRIKPGTYTVKCQSSSNQWEQLIEKDEVELPKNKKTEIDFYIGTSIE